MTEQIAWNIWIFGMIALAGICVGGGIWMAEKERPASLFIKIMWVVTVLWLAPIAIKAYFLIVAA